MPTVAKQTPRTTSKPAVNGKPAGSILGRAIPVADADDDWIHALIYGRNRVGKTTLACQFPKPLILVSVEPAGTGGAKSVKKVPGVEWVKLTKSEEVEKLAHELSTDNQFKSVVIDSGSSLEQIVLAEVCGWDEPSVQIAFGNRPGSKVTTDQYIERAERMKKLMRRYLALPKHVIVLANEKDHNPPEGRKSSLTRSLVTESFFAAAMGSGTVSWLQDGCDYVCQLYMDKETKTVEYTVGTVKKTREEETGKYVRRLRTAYHVNFAAGFRSENPDSVPEYIEATTPAEMYEKFMSVVRGEAV